MLSRTTLPARLAACAALCVGLAFCACSHDDPAGTGTVDSVPAMSLERLQSAPVTLDVPLTTPSLGTYLWRDFMPTPTPTPNQDLLRIVVTLTETAETPIPATVSLAYVWVIKDHEVWSSTLDEIRADFTLQGIASGGPRWETGSDVDVVVGIKVDKSLRLVRVPKQTINATF